MWEGHVDRLAELCGTLNKLIKFKMILCTVTYKPHTVRQTNFTAAIQIVTDLISKVQAVKTKIFTYRIL